MQQVVGIPDLQYNKNKEQRQTAPGLYGYLITTLHNPRCHSGNTDLLLSCKGDVGAGGPTFIQPERGEHTVAALVWQLWVSDRGETTGSPHASTTDSYP